MIRKTIWLTLATVLLAGWLGLVLADEAAEAAAVEAAEAWLTLTDGGEYDKSWETAASLFKGAVKMVSWRQSMVGVRQPLGKTLSREVKSTTYATSLPGAPDGEYVVIEFETSFENKKQAIETVTPMRDEDGKWRVSGYYIK